MSPVRHLLFAALALVCTAISASSNSATAELDRKIVRHFIATTSLSHTPSVAIKNYRPILVRWSTPVIVKIQPEPEYYWRKNVEWQVMSFETFSKIPIRISEKEEPNFFVVSSKNNDALITEFATIAVPENSASTDVYKSRILRELESGVNCVDYQSQKNGQIVQAIILVRILDRRRDLACLELGFAKGMGLIGNKIPYPYSTILDGNTGKLMPLDIIALRLLYNHSLSPGSNGEDVIHSIGEILSRDEDIGVLIKNFRGAKFD